MTRHLHTNIELQARRGQSTSAPMAQALPSQLPALTASSRHLVNADSLFQTKPGVRVVNVGRGPVIDEAALEAALQSGQVHSAASYLRQHPRCVFGSHHASNTADAVARTSEIAIGKLAGFFAEASQ